MTIIIAIVVTIIISMSQSRHRGEFNVMHKNSVEIWKLTRQVYYTDINKVLRMFRASARHGNIFGPFPEHSHVLLSTQAHAFRVNATASGLTNFPSP